MCVITCIFSLNFNGSPLGNPIFMIRAHVKFQLILKISLIHDIKLFLLRKMLILLFSGQEPQCSGRPRLNVLRPEDQLHRGQGRAPHCTQGKNKSYCSYVR